MVVKQTSLPLSLKEVCSLNAAAVLNNFDANAKPRALGICPAVGAISLLLFFVLTRSSQSPFLSTFLVAKCAFICLPALNGSLLISGSANNWAKYCSTFAIPAANIKV